MTAAVTTAATAKATLLLLFVLSSYASGVSVDGNQSFISVVVSDKGVAFVKDLLIDKAVDALTPLQLPDIEKDVKVPLVGTVRMGATNITLSSIDVSSSSARTGSDGFVVAVTGATANLTMDWFYSYSTWIVKISDKGRAFIQVEGMEVGLSIYMESHNGTLELNVTECGCYMKDLVIKVDGGASWFYQWFVKAFSNHIRSAAEDAITKKIIEGISKLGTLLQRVPKTIEVDDVAALNVAFVNDPLFGNSTVEFDINGLFFSPHEVSSSRSLYQIQISNPCDGSSKMLQILLDESVFNSASSVYFQAGIMHWIVDKVPQQSLLNTSSWMLIVPQLYIKYPNDEILLNISLTSPPLVRITSEKIMATVILDMTVLVLDNNDTVPVTCISVDVNVSGVVEISGNYLAGQVALDDFSLSLKWSAIGNFHLSLIQGVMRLFLNNVFVPYVNLRLQRGFPLPVIHGFILQNAKIITTSWVMFVCSDVEFTGNLEPMSAGALAYQ